MGSPSFCKYVSRKGASTDHDLNNNNIDLGIQSRKRCAVSFNSSHHVFVRSPVNDCDHLTTLIKRHLGQPGHSKCLEMSKTFISVTKDRSEDVSMLSDSFQNKISRNRNILKNILKTTKQRLAVVLLYFIELVVFNYNIIFQVSKLLP